MNEKAFSSIDFVGQCLIDEERTVAFQNAIESVVKPNHTVLDVGTGSGIMSLFAARVPAKNVHAIEFDPYIAKVANENISSNNFENVHIHTADARNIVYDFAPKFDVVIMEMITTGMVDEFQIQGVNNLHKQKAVTESTIFIPFRQDTFLTLLEVDFEHYGLQIPMVKHLWKWHDWSNLSLSELSDKALLNSIKFNAKTNETVDITLSIPVSHSGTVNAILLTSESFLTPEIILADTESLNAPVLVPIKERAVFKGEVVQLSVQYEFGGGYSGFSAGIL